MFTQDNRPIRLTYMMIAVIFLALAGCAAPTGADDTGAVQATDTESTAVEPDTGDPHETVAADSHTEGIAHADSLSPVDLADGEQLKVVASTNIVADVVARIGGDAIALTALIPTGADPHSYQARPADLRELDNAHVLFINGLGLEEALTSIFENLDTTDVVSVNEAVAVRAMDADGHGHDEQGEGEHAEDDHAHDEAVSEEAHGAEEHGAEEHGAEEHGSEEHSAEEHGSEEHGADEHEAHADGDTHGHDHDHGGNDPHTWMDVANVLLWVDTIEIALSALDPAHADQYAANADAYRAELTALDAEIRTLVETIPATRRTLVTDHDSFGYLADAYGFEIIGAVVPGLSTLATPSAQQLAALQDQMSSMAVPAIFVGTTVNPQIAERLAGDLGVEVIQVYTGSLSDQDGPAASYLDFMRYNANVLAETLAAD